MSEPTIKEILHTADGIREKAMPTSEDSSIALQKSFNSLERTVLRCKEERDQLLAALKGFMNLIDAGILVRNISRDSESGWALKQISLVKTLTDAHAAISKAEEP